MFHFVSMLYFLPYLFVYSIFCLILVLILEQKICNFALHMNFKTFPSVSANIWNSLGIKIDVNVILKNI